MQPAAAQRSPEYVQLSQAAAMALGYCQGAMRRGACAGCLNLLLTYPEGCAGRCAYCGLSPTRRVAPERRTFIRVTWPTCAVDDVLSRLGEEQHAFRRACVSMVTHPRALADAAAIVSRLRSVDGLPVTVLVAPTALADLGQMATLREAGADRIGVGLDAATPDLFGRWRGPGVSGPHRWEHYREALQEGVRLFGRGQVGAHLIVGLGETEQQMAALMQALHDEGVCVHLFSFFPEAGTPLGERRQPPIAQYRRVQLARYVIEGDLGRCEAMRFDEDERIVDFGLPIDCLVGSGAPFETSGCSGRDGAVACNRPFGNERASEPLRNYPFAPEPEDVALIRYQLGDCRQSL
ncbi:MAG: radical SAM protein [Anaerolineae bacterium]